MRTPLRLFVPLLVLAAAVCHARSSPTPPFGPFWPTPGSLQRAGFDFWRVWRTRCEVRREPTSAYNLAERREALTVWADELRREKLPVDDVVPRPRLAKIVQMISVRDIAGACQEVDAVYRALEAMVTGKESVRGVGKIQGRILDDTGGPAAGADVLLYGTPLGAISDPDGAFTISDVPCLSPRYVLQARKPGYLDAFTGGVAPQAGRPGEAVLLLEKATPENSYRTDCLAVKVARLVQIKQVTDPAVPIDTAVADPAKYPENVKPYLKACPSIDSDNAAVKALAQQILVSLSEPERQKSTAIARAVYRWLVSNIEGDTPAVYPDDPTGGEWEAMYGGWSRSFGDWAAKPSEVLAQRRGTSRGCEALAAALLRALNVPARPATAQGRSVCQWWVQLPAGNGYWANMDTAGGRMEFLRNGNLTARFPAAGDHAVAFYSVDERAPVLASWDAAAPGLWLQIPGEEALYGSGDRGLKSAQTALAGFADKGVVPGGSQRPPSLRPIKMDSGYQVASEGVVLNLTGLGAQQKLTFRFPVFVTNQYRETLDVKAWTNHPEWVKATRREKEQNKFTGEGTEFFCVDFEFSAPKPKPPAEAKPAEAKPGGEKPPTPAPK